MHEISRKFRLINDTKFLGKFLVKLDEVRREAEENYGCCRHQRHLDSYIT